MRAAINTTPRGVNYAPPGGPSAAKRASGLAWANGVGEKRRAKAARPSGRQRGGYSSSSARSHCSKLLRLVGGLALHGSYRPRADKGRLRPLLFERQAVDAVGLAVVFPNVEHGIARANSLDDLFGIERVVVVCCHELAYKLTRHDWASRWSRPARFRCAAKLPSRQGRPKWNHSGSLVSGGGRASRLAFRQDDFALDQLREVQPRRRIERGKRAGVDIRYFHCAYHRLTYSVQTARSEIMRCRRNIRSSFHRHFAT